MFKLRNIAILCKFDISLLFIRFHLDKDQKKQCTLFVQQTFICIEDNKKAKYPQLQLC